MYHSSNSGDFDKTYDKIQDDLEVECGADDFVTGMSVIFFVVVVSRCYT